MGLLYGVFIHKANNHDTVQGINAINQVKPEVRKNIQKIIADKGYRKTFVNQCNLLNL